ncbi:MAG: Type secretion system protein precursor [Planctomycetota bacterium]
MIGVLLAEQALLGERPAFGQATNQPPAASKDSPAATAAPPANSTTSGNQPETNTTPQRLPPVNANASRESLEPQQPENPRPEAQQPENPRPEAQQPEARQPEAQQPVTRLPGAPSPETQQAVTRGSTAAPPYPSGPGGMLANPGLAFPRATLAPPGDRWRSSESPFDRGGDENRRAGGMMVGTPVLPTMNPRPGSGPTPDEQWSRVRPMTDNDSMGGFASPLQGTDATLELILGQGRLLTLKRPVFRGPRDAMIAIGDPSIVDFELLPNPQLMRLIARRAGVTDLTITGADGKTFSFEVRVVYDLPLLEAHLRQLFPDAMVKLSQIREHLVVEGQARSPQQVGQIIEVLDAFLGSMTGGISGSASGGGMGGGGMGGGLPGSVATPFGVPAADDPSGAGQSPDGVAPDDGTPSEPPAGEGGEGDAPDAVPGEDDAMAGRPPRLAARLASTQSPVDAMAAASQDRRAASVGDMTLPGMSWGGGGGGSSRGRSTRGRLINLLTVPGSQQVMLNVRIAELNRTAMRRIGADIVSNFGSGGVFNTRMSGSTSAGDAASAASTLFRLNPSSGTTAVAIVPGGGFDLALTALRQNAVVSILAEPNLIAYSGQQASFLAGGEFPVPVPQNSGAGVTSVGLQYKEYGVKLNFTPVVLTEETIRLRVSPEASTIDTSTGTAISGTAVPGINTRRVDTTVELGQGQTLVLAGLLSVSLDAQTSRIPGLGDLPYLGPLFSNTSHQRVEKELLVLVTPYLVRPLNPEQLPGLPGCEIQEPNDLEFFFLNRIEGRTGRPFRSTTAWDDPWNLRHTLRFESRNLCGPVGFSDFSNKPITDSPPPTPQTAAQRSSRR